MKTIDRLFQETEIHFLLQNEGEVMVNATEMAKAFGKRTDVFLKTDHVKAFLEVLNRPPNGGSLDPLSEDQLIQRKGRSGVYFNRLLALKFAAWLDPEFEVWVFSQIDNILFGHYKKHWDSHAAQEQAKEKMERIKKELLNEPIAHIDQKKVAAYFEAEKEYKDAKNSKTRAIRNQLKLFSE